MSKLIFIAVIIAALAITINADADADSGFPNSGLFPGFPRFQIPAIPPIKMLTPDDIKNMAPKDPNTHVVGTSISSSSSSETVNGVPVKRVNKERVVTNNDGKVTDNTYAN